MDTCDGGKKTSKKSKLFKDESGPSSKRWMRSNAKKDSVKVGASAGNSASGENKGKIDQDQKSTFKGTKKPKLSSNTEHKTSPKRSDETGQGEVSKKNSVGGEKKTKIETGKGKKRKLVNSADGSGKPPKRRLDDNNKDHQEETVAKESGELPSFNLPGELWTKIIDMVPISQWASLESVNHQFQDVVHGLWGQQREIRLNELAYNENRNPDYIVNSALSKFLIRAPNVASINGFDEFFDKRTRIRPPTIRLLSMFEHLQTIDFSGGEVITVKNFAEFLESSASRQSWKRLNILDGIFGEMKRHKVVDSTGDSKENQPALKLECFKFNAKYLHIFDRFLPIDWSILKKLIIDSSISGKELLSIIRRCTQVTHLEVPYCSNGNGQQPYGEFVQAVADLENLSVLKIDGCYGSAFQDALVVLIEDLHHRRITDLALMSCHCSDQIIDAIIHHLPHLKSLDIDVEFCPTASLLRLANEMGQLETLKIQALSTIGRPLNADFIRAIGDNMSNLQCLHIDYMADIVINFTSLGNLRNLKELRIIGERLESETIEAWNRQGFGSCLETLEVCLGDISPKVMGRFFKNMSRLRSLELSEAVTRPILNAIAKFCPKLTELKIDYPSTAGIQHVISRCSQLKLLKFINEDGRKNKNEWFPSKLTVEKYRKITFEPKEMMEDEYVDDDDD